MNTGSFDSQYENILLIPIHPKGNNQTSNNHSYALSEDQALRLKLTDSKIIS